MIFALSRSLPSCVSGHARLCRAFSVAPSRTVIDAASASLGLDLAELEPTVRALKRYGNQSSASFMFAYPEFLQHPPCAIAVGDCGAFITMGPGAGIEVCLWTAGARAASERCVPLAGWVPASLPRERSSLVRRIDDPPL